MPKNKRDPRRASRNKSADLASVRRDASRRRFPNLRTATFRITAAGLILAASGLLLYLCYLQQFVTFREYDDEGYVLLTLRQFMHGLPLYDRLFTQYGPFPFVWRSFFHTLTNSEATHDATRLISIVTRVFLGASCAGFFFSATRNFFLAILLYVQMTVFLVALVDEPGHPQETVLLLFAITLLVASLARRLLAMEKELWIIGAAAGAMLLTKINIGGFFVASCLMPLLATKWDFRLGNTIRLLFAALVLAIPFLLMRDHISHGAGTYCVIVTISLFAVLAADFRYGEKPPFNPKWIGSYFLGMAIAGIAILIPVFIKGTTIHGLIVGLIVEPVRFSSRFFALPSLSFGGVVSSLVFAALGISYLFSGTLLGLSAERTRIAIAVLKLTAGTWGIYLGLLQGRPFALLTFLPGALWLLSAGLGPALVSTHGKMLRLLLMNLAALQSLQAYPVAGSQVTWATFLILLACYLLLHDGWAYFAESFQFRPAFPSMLTVGATSITCFSMMFWLYETPGISGLLHQFRGNRPALLPGAERLHMPTGLAYRYESLASSIRNHCDSLITMPGVGSLNVWSGIDPPTGWNATAWMTLIDVPKQQEEVAKLRATARPCAVVCEGCVGFWLTGQDIRAEPLVRYIRTELASFSVMDGYDLRMRPDLTRGNPGDLR